MAVRRIVPVLGIEDGSAGFYAEMFGLEAVMDLGWVVNLGSQGGPQLLLMSADATAPVKPDVSIEVDDVDAAYAAAVRIGAEIVHPLTDEDWGVRRFFVRDPDGKVVNVVSHR